MTPRFVPAAAVSVVWAIATVASMTYGITYNWPDFVHVNYGFPVAFATHTISTFTGAADSWAVDLGSLATDLAFWALGMIAVFLVVGYLAGWRSRKTQPDRA